MNRLLILSCSQRKRLSNELLPAVERYDGPSFRLLRRFLRHAQIKPAMMILSAKYGLINCEYLIPYYDQGITRSAVQHLRPQVGKTLQTIFRGSADKPLEAELFLCMGKSYLETFVENVPSHVLVKHAQGSPGNKLVALHDWLYARYPTSGGNHPEVPLRATFRLRGQSFTLTQYEALEVARMALPQQNHASVDRYSWYVEVEGSRVSPKWLVSLLTGFPVSAFHTDEARRVLRQIGIAVQRERYQ